MTDHPTGPGPGPDPGPDPLAGRDPHPRERIDLWPLHDARQELLEEIVSQPGSGQSATRSKVLLSVVGIAAALVLVVGGAWAVTRGGSDPSGPDDALVAAQSSEAAPTDPADPTSETTTTPTKDPRKHGKGTYIRINGDKVRTVRDLRNCARATRGELGVTLEELRRFPRLPRMADQSRWIDVYVIKRGADGCRLVYLRDRVKRVP